MNESKWNDGVVFMKLLAGNGSLSGTRASVAVVWTVHTALVLPKGTYATNDQL